MKEQKAGTIINVISQSGLYGKAERSVYGASKFALTGFTKSLEPELEKYGIRVAGLYPGKIATGMFAKVGISKDMSDALAPADVARAVSYIISQPDYVTITELGLKARKH
jgi:short-subunit dehydrogenase